MYTKNLIYTVLDCDRNTIELDLKRKRHSDWLQKTEKQGK